MPNPKHLSRKEAPLASQQQKEEQRTTSSTCSGFWEKSGRGTLASTTVCAAASLLLPTTNTLQNVHTASSCRSEKLCVGVCRKTYPKPPQRGLAQCLLVRLPTGREGRQPNDLVSGGGRGEEGEGGTSRRRNRCQIQGKSERMAARDQSERGKSAATSPPVRLGLSHKTRQAILVNTKVLSVLCTTTLPVLFSGQVHVLWVVCSWKGQG